MKARPPEHVVKLLLLYYYCDWRLMISEEERDRRIHIVKDQADIYSLGEPCGEYWYLSFADETGFLGACVVEAPNELVAVAISHQLGINPGGEVAMVGPFTLEQVKSPINVLLSREDLEA